MPIELTFASNFLGNPLLNKVPAHLRSSLVFCCANGSRSPGISRRRALLKFASRVSAASLTAAFPVTSSASVTSGFSSAYDVDVLKDKKLTSLSSLRKKVTLFVNVASYCAVRECCGAPCVHALGQGNMEYFSVLQLTGHLWKELACHCRTYF